LAYRVNAERLEVLLVRPGGPFWRNKDDGACRFALRSCALRIDADRATQGGCRLIVRFGFKSPVADANVDLALRARPPI
jgi:hypothetical protein